MQVTVWHKKLVSYLKQAWILEEYRNSSLEIVCSPYICVGFLYYNPVHV